MTKGNQLRTRLLTVLVGLFVLVSVTGCSDENSAAPESTPESANITEAAPSADSELGSVAPALEPEFTPDNNPPAIIDAPTPASPVDIPAATAVMLDYTPNPQKIDPRSMEELLAPYGASIMLAKNKLGTDYLAGFIAADGTVLTDCVGGEARYSPSGMTVQYASYTIDEEKAYVVWVYSEERDAVDVGSEMGMMLDLPTFDGVLSIMSNLQDGRPALDGFFTVGRDDFELVR